MTAPVSPRNTPGWTSQNVNTITAATYNSQYWTSVNHSVVDETVSPTAGQGDTDQNLP